MNTQQLAASAGAPLRAQFTQSPFEVTTQSRDALNAFLRIESRSDAPGLYFKTGEMVPSELHEPECVWSIPEHDVLEGFAKTVEAP
jgi:hypothetical protein